MLYRNPVASVAPVRRPQVQPNLLSMLSGFGNFANQANKTTYGNVIKFGQGLASGMQQSAGSVADAALMGSAALEDAKISLNPFIPESQKAAQRNLNYYSTEKYRNKIKNTKTVTGESLNRRQDYQPTGNFVRDAADLTGRGLSVGLDATTFINPTTGLVNGVRRQGAKQAFITGSKLAGTYGPSAGVASGLETYGQTGDVNKAIESGLTTGVMSGLGAGGLHVGGHMLGAGGREAAELTAKRMDEVNIHNAHMNAPTVYRSHENLTLPEGVKIDPVAVKGYENAIINGRETPPIVVKRTKDGRIIAMDNPSLTQAYLNLNASSIPTRRMDSGIVKSGGYIAGPGAKGFPDAQKAGRVFEGVDKKPRFEVTDHEARLVARGDAADKLENLLDHPTLYNNYPQLRNLPVDIKVDKNFKGAEGGSFTPGKGIEIYQTNHAKAKKTLLHEIQHAIQKEEGFAKGGSPENMMDDVVDRYRPEVENLPAYKALTTDAERKAFTLDYAKMADPNNRLDSALVGDYRRLAGEAEARAVAERRNMTDAERYVPQEGGKTVYHGSSVGGGGTGDRYGKGFYVTTDKSRASGYAKGGTVDEYSLDGVKLANLDDKLDNKIVDTLKKEVNDLRNNGDDYYKDVLRLSGDEKTFSVADIDSARKFYEEKIATAKKLGLGEDSMPRFSKDKNGNFKVSYIDDTLESLKNIDGNRLFRSLPSPTAQSLFVSAGYDGVSTRGMGGDIESVIYRGNLKKALKEKDASTPRSTFYDSLDVPKDELIVRGAAEPAASKVPDLNSLKTEYDDILQKVRNRIASDADYDRYDILKDQIAVAEGKKQAPNPERWTTDKPIKMPSEVYRGTSKDTGNGFAMFGQGFYTAASKSEAAQYGAVAKLGADALPKNPIQFKSVPDFKQWEYEIARQKGIPRKKLYGQDKGPHNVAGELGYDGITIGQGKDLIAVRFDPSVVRKSETAMSIDPEYKSSKTVRKAEDDFIAGKISPDKLEKIRQVEASTNDKAPIGLDGKSLEVDGDDVILYHRTSKKSAAAIAKEGKLDPNRAGTGNDKAITEDGRVSYLTTNPSQDFYGEAVVKVRMPLQEFKKKLQENAEVVRKMEDEIASGKVPDMYVNDMKRQIENIKANPEIISDKPLSVLTKTARTAPKKALPQAQSRQPSTSKRQLPEDTAFTSKLNTERVGLTNEAKLRLDRETNEVIGRLSNDEVKTFAKAAGMDMKNYSVERTRKRIAEQLNLRNEIATIETQIAAAKKSGASKTDIAALMEKSAALGRTSRTQGTDLARQLQARRIIADQLATPQQKLFRLFDEAGVDPEDYTKRLVDVDMNNADDVMKAYRDLVPATAQNWLDKYRYTNMLSSPLTHIVNITSNASGLAGVAPVEKVFAGAVDATKSALTGKARTRFAGEAGAYYKGAAQSFPEAIQKFSDVMTGKKMMEMPDADSLKNGKLAYGGVKGAADTVLSFVPKLLEASDQLGMTLARGGESRALNYRGSKGVTLPNDFAGAVDDMAKYRVFRQDLGVEGQGHLLGAVDAIPQAILTMRRSKNPAVSTIAKYTIPFVTTPVNLFKQGIEYSPAGIITLAGNTDKTAQVAKMLMGTTVVATAAGALAAKDSITFGEPTEAKQRDAFRAEGKQPYAIKVGDKWFGYQKLHPAISFNLATVGAVKEAMDKGAIDQSEADKIMATVGGVIGYFRDQSYMKSVGDFTANLEMKDGASLGDAFATTTGNYANQLSPFKSMVSWVGRMIDPTQRKVDYSATPPEQIYQMLVRDIPGLNKNVPARLNPYYPDSEEPILNDNPGLNSFTPIRVTNDKGYGNTTGLNITERREMNQLPDADRPGFRQAAIDEKFRKKQEKAAKEDGTAPKSSSSASKTTTSKSATTSKSSEYDTALSRYKKAKAEGTLNDVEDSARQKSLEKLKIGSKYDEEVRDLYNLSKTEIYDYITKNPNGSALAEQLQAYDKALKAAGLVQYEKFRTGMAPAASGRRASASTGRKTAARGTAGGNKRTAAGIRQTLASERAVTRSAISTTSGLSRRVASAKVKKMTLPMGKSVRKPGILAYKKNKTKAPKVTRRHLA